MRAFWPAAAAAALLIAAACSEPTASTPASVAGAGPSFDLLGGGCPDKFVLSKGTKVTADFRVVGRDPVDDNADGYRCQAITKEPVYNDDKTLRSQGVVVLIDNNIPANAIGKCPLTFTAVINPGAGEDLNGNLVTCEVPLVDESGAETGVLAVDDVDH